MLGSGKDVSGVVGISQNGSGAGTFPDTLRLAGPLHIESIPVLTNPGCTGMGPSPDRKMLEGMEQG